jgi:hypothetical protein
MVSVALLGALAVAGCAERTVPAPPAAGAPRAGAEPARPTGSSTKRGLIVTPDNALVGKVVLVNATARYVVLTFPLGKMAAAEQRLGLYRGGLKVGEVKITGWQREDNVVADLVAGEAEVGDEARGP